MTEPNIKQILDALNNLTQLKDDLSDLCDGITDRLTNISDFTQNLCEDIMEDRVHLHNIKRLRNDLKYVNDNLLLIFNNLEVDTAVPRDTTGTKVD